ncbi:TPA: capsular biosynthesis protein, partial [Candidatus Uhrbacteria bacterium]|nr:capsular biosynthesis protein [Candidatus Uhrbacteria bacterium]
GADLIVGSHPHMVQDIELVDGVPVVYSLGNFIFDQYNVEGWNQLAIGVMTDGENLSLRLLPTYGRGGRPTPISDTAATAIFKSIAER